MATQRSQGVGACLMACRRCVSGVRRAAGALSLYRLADRRFIFAVAAVSVLSCKLLHIYVHLLVLSRKSLVLWWPSLFAQDVAVLLLLRAMMEPSWLAKPLRVLCLLLSSLVALVQLGVASCTITFFLMIGAEPRWRNVGLVTDSSSWAIMMTGVWSFAGTIFGLLLAALVLATPIYAFTGAMISSTKAALTSVSSKILSRVRSTPKYDLVAQEDEDVFEDEKDLRLLAEPRPATPSRGVWLLRIAGAALAFQVINSALRPPEQAFTFLSWTSLALPAVDYLTSNDQPLAELAAVYQDGLVEKWDRPSTLTEPRRWSWLEKIENLAPGFSDWEEEDQTHYNPQLDPLSHQNFDQELLPGLQGKLADVDIRNVVVLFLESTRKDVFPLKKDEWIWSRLKETWSGGKFSDEAYERAKTLTANARFLTGDYNDGFEHHETPRRGGINVQRNTPSATYTLKSLAGGLCGVSPLVADTNLDYDNRIYQPCLPHLFKTFNELSQGESSDDKPAFVGRSWNNSFMMSVTGQYDHQYELMQSIGYQEDEMVDSEYLKSDAAAFGPTEAEDIRYDGMPEIAVEDYIRDAFESSGNKGSRLFLTHLTSSTHFPYGLPENETYVPLVQDDANEDLQDISKHLNAVGYVDRWVGKILDIIDQQGVANETLVVLLGDHGVPVIETGGASPWGVPLIGSYLVPMVFSHPKLPVVDVPELVSSMSMLPTVLDLLIETGSLSESEEEAARDLLHSYEAPSLIRPLSPSPSQEVGGSSGEERQWYFTSVSPGGQTIAVRSMDDPRWRVLVPLIHDGEWSFSDLEEDPHEQDTLAAMEYGKFVREVEAKHGIDAAKWAEEAAFATRWWLKENHERWRYTP